jgi:2'-phosphotransferase
LLYVPPSAPAPATTTTSSDDADGSATIALESTEIAMKTASSDENQQSATAHALSVKDKDPSRFLIRATQGHSITSVDSETFLERLTLSSDDAKEGGTEISSSDLPDTVVHGTFHGAWPLILASGGLRAMGRTKVHFATGPSLDEVLQQIELERNTSTPVHARGGRAKTVISGMRSDAQILIYIDLKKALAAGCPFYRSENGVILSEGIDKQGDTAAPSHNVIPLEFFDVVVERKERLGVLWKDGEVVQELPANLADKLNPKGRQGGGNRGRGRGGKRRGSS